MKSAELKQLASDMIAFCEDNRSCAGCPGSVHIEEFKGTLCIVSGFADNDCRLTLPEIMLAITELIGGHNE